MHEQQARSRRRVRRRAATISAIVLMGTRAGTATRGPVLVTVKEGALRLIYADDTSCKGTDYSAGDSFVDRGDANVHIARNLSVTNNLVIWATYFVPGDPGTTPFRIDQADPGTGC